MLSLPYGKENSPRKTIKRFRQIPRVKQDLLASIVGKEKSNKNHYPAIRQFNEV